MTIHPRWYDKPYFGLVERLARVGGGGKPAKKTF